MIYVLPSIFLFMNTDNMINVKFKYRTNQVHHSSLFFYLNALTLFYKALGLLILGSHLTTLLRFLKNF